MFSRHWQTIVAGGMGFGANCLGSNPNSATCKFYKHGLITQPPDTSLVPSINWGLSQKLSQRVIVRII